MPTSIDARLHERDIQLQDIIKRRNELLRQLYIMMRKREDGESVLTLQEKLSEENDEDAEWREFLERFDMMKNAQTGAIANLSDDELLATLSRATLEPKTSEDDEAGSPSEESSEDHVSDEDSSMSEPPVSPGSSIDQQVVAEKSDVEEAEAELLYASSSIKEGTPMEVDQRPKTSPSPSERASDDGIDEGEVRKTVSQGETPRSSPPTRQVHQYVDEDEDEDEDDERDELDLIGSPSPSPVRSMPRPSSMRHSAHLSATPQKSRDHSMMRSPSRHESMKPYAVEYTADAPTFEDEHGQEADEKWEDAPEELHEDVGPGEVHAEEVVDAEEKEEESSEEEQEAEETQEVSWETEEQNREAEEAAHEVSQQRMSEIQEDRGEDVIMQDRQSEEMEVPDAPQKVAADEEVSSPMSVFSPEQFFERSPLLEHIQVDHHPLIPLPSSPIHDLPPFDFTPIPDHPPKQSSPSRANTYQAPDRPPFKESYTLPPLKILPPEYQRRSKLKQLRKKDKDKEKEKPDWTPMGLNRWAATLHHNPVWRKVSRATKCLSTGDWMVAYNELKFIRALDRIEQFKDTGKWSYRQPKKQRGVGGLMKTHWDYLLDEMKWMRTDFREERRWKTLLAYELAHAAVAWHYAGSWEERVKQGICVRWRRPHDEDLEEASGMVISPEQAEDDEMEIDKPDGGHNKKTVMSMVDYPSSIASDDDQDEEQDEERVRSRNDSIQLKIEDVEDTNVLQDNRDDMQTDTGPVLSRDTEDTPQATAKDEEDQSSALKLGSSNPVVGHDSHSSSAAADIGNSGIMFNDPRARHRFLRDQLAYSDDMSLFWNLDLDAPTDVIRPVAPPAQTDPKHGAPHPHDLSAIFPDLQPYTLLDVAPPPIYTTMEAKRKAEKKDKDDPDRRIEEALYTKLTPVGRFMFTRPTLIGSLEPAKHWRDGHWEGMDDAIVAAEYRAPSVRDDNLPQSTLFHEKAPSSPTIMPLSLPGIPREPRKRALELVWTPNEDLLLKLLAEKSPNNWRLISDTFNSYRTTTSIDRRSPFDCFDRWNLQWGTGIPVLSQDPQERNSVPVSEDMPPPPPPSQMTTRGHKRMASAAFAAATSSPATTTPAPGGEPRKRRRRQLIFDMLRKSAKKRETSHKNSVNQRKSSQIHDTHGQYNKMPKLSPLELSQMKYERDARQSHERAVAMRNEELTRQQMLREQTHRLSGLPNMQQQAPMLPQVQAAPRIPGAGLPAPQGVPQIRSQVNISQQQRMPNPMTAGPRVSSQTILQMQQQHNPQLAAQQRALAAQAQVQAQAQIPSSTAMSGAHLSPPYTSRAATSSPVVQGSPPRASATPSNAANSPRPPSAQAHPGVSQLSQGPSNSMQRPGSMGPYSFPVVPNIHGSQITQEQIERAMRMQINPNIQNIQGMMQGHQAGHPQMPQNGSPYHPQQ